MEDSVEGIDRRLSEEETKTADDGVSVLKLPDKVVHVFHESKSSEGDDVFEEALTDANPEEMRLEEHRQEPDPEEDIVNGDGNGVSPGNSGPLVANRSADEAPEMDTFEEAAENKFLSEDGSGEVERPIAVEEQVEELVTAGNDNKVKATDGVGDDDDSVKEFKPVESNGSLVGHGESDTNKLFPVSVDGETKSEETTGSSVDTIYEKPDNGHLDKVKLEEMPSVFSETLDVDEADSDKINLSEGSESNGQLLSLDSQMSERKDDMAGVDASVHEEIETPEVREDITNLVASVDEETEDLELKSPFMEHSSTKRDENYKVDVAEVVAKAGQISDANRTNENIQESSEDNVAEIAATNGHISDAYHTNENIEESPEDHAVFQVPEEQETQDQNGIQGPVSIKTSGTPSSTRDPEIQTAVDTSQPPRRPAGLGGAASLLEPAPRAVQQPRANGGMSQRQTHIVEDPLNGEAEENNETREKLQMIRVKFLRLAHRLGQTPHNVVVAQVLYRLGLAEQLRGRNTGRVGAFSFDRASAVAEQLEAVGQEPLDFSCTIMVLGKTGVGKSATTNSIFDEIKFGTDAFQMGTKKVQDVVGTVQGIKVRVIDTPGLLPCWSDQRQNEKILHSVKRFIKKTPPDIVLYLDRLDMQSRDFGDMPLLRTITEIFGPSIWFNAIVVLTHAASAPPDGPNGTASSYEMFVTQRSHVVQQAIRQAAGDMRLMNPVSLVENHSACRTNRAGQRVLPNGQVWKPHLLLLSFASKILAEANTLLKLQDSPPGKPFASRPRVPPLPLLLSSLLQSRPQLKLPEEQFGDEDDDPNEDSDDSSGSDDELDYDELPPFKRLSRAQLAKLSKVQKKAYFDELDYREKLFLKKQLKEEKKRRKLLKKMGASAKDSPNDYNESVEEESGSSASVPVAMPDFALPTSFDSDNPSHRYRFLDTSNQWLVRPVLETHGWDHDVGYEGINVERLFVVKEKIPVSFSGQVTKDKKESNIQLELASSIRHGEGKATSLGFDMQTVGKDMAYTLRSETRFCNLRRNKTAAGLSVTFLGDALSAGMKLEDRLIVNKRFRLVLTGGAMTGRGDVAYGGSLEATLRDKDYPLGHALSTLGLSVMDWHGDLAVGCNVQTQLPIGRTTNMIARANLNNRGAGQVSIRLNSSEQLQIALIAFLPLFKKALGHYQQMMYGEQGSP